MGITLHVGGGIVTGHLIGGREYSERIATHFLGEGQTRNAAHDWMIDYGNLYPKQDEEGEPDKPASERPAPQYIHLRDAYFVAPGSAPIPNNRGVLWRGTLNSVSGWSLGVLSASDGESAP